MDFIYIIILTIIQQKNQEMTNQKVKQEHINRIEKNIIYFPDISQIS